MKSNPRLTHMLLVAALLALVSSALPLPVAAGLTTTSSGSQAANPGEWPVIGPVLQWLGVARPAMETPTPTPGLTEYRVTSYDDIGALQEIPSGERVRIIISETDLNAIVLDLVSRNVEGNAGMSFGMEPNLLNVRITADQSLLEQAADYLPRQIRGDLDLDGAFRLGASQCVPRVTVERLRLNGWSFGLRLLAQGPINARIREFWTDDICVERVLLMQGEAAVEGYRR
jgi:hypothetical protein